MVKQVQRFPSLVLCSLLFLTCSGELAVAATKTGCKPVVSRSVQSGQQQKTSVTQHSRDLVLTGIIGQGAEWLALIRFRDKTWIVHREMIVDKYFKVVDILPDRLVIQFQNESNQRIFPIGGGK